MINQNTLKNLIDYNKEAGVFTRKISTSNGANAGDIAGTTHPSGYKKIRVLGINNPISSHRLAWFYVYGVWPDYIDHINGVRGDNRIKNLRSVSKAENNLNKKIFKNNSSGVSGLNWIPRLNKWRVRIGVSGKYQSVGCFQYKWDAICARKSAENRHGYHLNHATRIY